LVFVTLVCTFQRWRGVWRRVFHRPVRCSDAAFDKAPHMAKLAAPPEADFPSIVRRNLEQRGFRVRFETVEGIVYVRGDRHWLTPLATLVTHLAVLLLALGAALSGLYGWREEVAIGPGETVEVGRGSGLALRNEGFVIARYPDGSAAGYVADIVVVEAGRDVTHGGVQLNQPLSYGGVSLILHSYAGAEGRYSVTLLAVRDPGYGLFVAGGFLLFLGLTVSFNLPHCWIHTRVDAEGELRLAGRADCRAWAFEREFAALVSGIAQSVRSDL
jgi:cytochrome c biogenesis protein ResB